MEQQIYSGVGWHLWSTNPVKALLTFVKGAFLGRHDLQHRIAVMEAAAAIDILVVDEAQMAPAINVLVIDESQIRI
jgi:hypothetical protein